MPPMVYQFLTVRMVQQVNAKTLVRCLKARRWLVRWVISASRHNLEIVAVDDTQGIILIEGAVPGSRMVGFLFLTRSKKCAQKKHHSQLV